MSNITKQHVGKYTYLYESTSYRDENGKPRNKKVRIGSIDPKTGATVYLQSYIDKMAQQGVTVKSDVQHVYSEAELDKILEELTKSVKSYGAYYFYNQLAQKIGLLPILQEVFPNTWDKLFDIACYISATGDAMMYCADWLSETLSKNADELSSQRISEFFDYAISADERNTFYSKWTHYISEKDFIALDITSISSYSRLMGNVKWGYNRDKEPLPQINLCMLMGETTRLPVYQVILNGSLKDVMVIDYVTGIIKQLFPDINIKLAMDKGFYSAKNLNCMKDDNNPKEWRFQFLIAVPFTTGFAKQLVSEEKDSIDRIENTIKLPEGTLRGVHKLCDWPGIGELHTFVYLNPKASLQVKDDLFAYVKELMEAAESNPEDSVRKKEFDKYLLITKDKNTGSYSMSINYDKVNEELETVGSMVLLSNYIDKPEDAIRIYRNKNFVEKGFDKMKNSLGMERLYLHSDERAETKMFCSFIALILECAIDAVLDKNDLHKKYTIKKLILELSHIKYGEVLGKKVIAPLSKEQRNIFKAFEMKAPATVNRKVKA